MIIIELNKEGKYHIKKIKHDNVVMEFTEGLGIEFNERKDSISKYYSIEEKFDDMQYLKIKEFGVGIEYNYTESLEDRYNKLKNVILSVYNREIPNLDYDKIGKYFEEKVKVTDKR
jgi:hypothetical protein